MQSYLTSSLMDGQTFIRWKLNHGTSWASLSQFAFEHNNLAKSFWTYSGFWINSSGIASQKKAPTAVWRWKILNSTNPKIIKKTVEFPHTSVSISTLLNFFFSPSFRVSGKVFHNAEISRFFVCASLPQLDWNERKKSSVSRDPSQLTVLLQE